MILKAKYKQMKKLSYIFILVVLPILSFGNKQLMVDVYYAKGQYKEAVVGYQQMVNEGYKSAVIYYNLGNAYYKLGDIPSALLYYEKAHKLSPGDDDINFNIRYVNSKTTDKVEEAPEFFLNRWGKAFILSFSLGTLSLLSIVFILLGSVILVVYFFATAISIKKLSFYSSIVLFFLGLLTVFIAGRQSSYFDNHKQAIVFTSSVDVKGGPVEQSKTLFVIHDGTKVNVLESNNSWMKVGLANGNVGWIKASDAKEI
jgi:tetratricopeptide (TPR) repeat protein